MQDTAHAAEAPTARQGGPLEDPLEHARGCTPPSGGLRPIRGGALTSSGLRLARGSAPPSNGVRLARGRSAHARPLPNAGIQCPDNGGAAPSCDWGSRPGAAAPTPREGAHPRHCGGTVRRGQCQSRDAAPPTPVRLTRRALEGGPAAPSICFSCDLAGLGGGARPAGRHPCHC
jgi:hypothetical protein